MSGGNPPVLALIVMTGGVIMLMAAVYDLNPLEAMKNIVTGKNPKDAKVIAGGNAIPITPGITPPNAPFMIIPPGGIQI